MRTKECIAMLLAGGQGNRLGILTKNLAKPAVPFGGKYRIIDFALSNCTNSDIDTVGVLTQYRPLKLNSYIGSGQPWDLDRLDGGVYVLPPYVRGKVGEWYKGTANAIYQNIEFIEQYNPQNVLVLSGDHIYKMDYRPMIAHHKKNKAAATIAVIQVPWEETGRFGIIDAAEEGQITDFEEKPKNARNNKASMGVYIFNWELLKRYLTEDDREAKSEHDFGKNIIPKMLNNYERLFVYPFNGYWKDVGTIRSLWEANMDLLEYPPKFDLYDPSWRIYGRNQGEPPHYLAAGASVRESIITEGSLVYGCVEHSVIFTGVFIGAGATVRDSIVMPYTRVGEGSHICNTIIGEKVIVGSNCEIGRDGENSITVIEGNLIIHEGSIIGSGVMVDDAANIRCGNKPAGAVRKGEKAI